MITPKNETTPGLNRRGMIVIKVDQSDVSGGVYPGLSGICQVLFLLIDIQQIKLLLHFLSCTMIPQLKRQQK
jgi:hypothetical protein